MVLLTFRFFFKYPLIFTCDADTVDEGDDVADLIAGCFVVASDLHTAVDSGEFSFAVVAFSGVGTVFSALDTTAFGCNG